MNPTSLKQHVNRLAARVVHIHWCERHIAQREDIGDYVQKPHFYDSNFLRLSGNPFW